MPQKYKVEKSLILALPFYKRILYKEPVMIDSFDQSWHLQQGTV